MEKETQDNPWIRTILPEITPPSLKDNTADVDRLIKGIKRRLHAAEITIDFSQAKSLPRFLRKSAYHVKATLFQDRKGWQLIDVGPVES